MRQPRWDERGLRLGAFITLITLIGIYLAGIFLIKEPRTVGFAADPAGATPRARSESSDSFFSGLGHGPGLEAHEPIQKRVKNGGESLPSFFSVRNENHRGAGEGRNLLSGSSRVNAHTDKGRIVRLRAGSVRDWSAWSKGMKISFPDLDGGVIPAVINFAHADGNWLRVGGGTVNPEGSFVVSMNFEKVWGLLLFPQKAEAWEIRTEPMGEIVMVQKRIESVLCVGSGMVPDIQAEASAAAASSAGAESGGTSLSIANGAQVPLINTRPGARGVVYLDFDGENVIDPFWYRGELIEARPTILTRENINEIVARVVEDYAPFDLTFTTDKSLYDGAGPGRRMRVIVTPTTLANPFGERVEGIAYTHSWSRAGELAVPGNTGAGVFESDIPAWAFDTSRSAKIVAEVISHELGHTFGLSHDGQTKDGVTVECYPGSERDVGSAVGWAPIMGKPYSRPLSQWSKGEYRGANNTEDDLAIIARAANGFGLVGASPSESRPLPILCTQGTFEVSGVLRSAQSAHLFHFQTLGGTFAVLAGPVSPQFANVDVSVDLLDSGGSVLARSDLQGSLGAALSGTLRAGSYALRVMATGSSDPSAEGYEGGYSSYASLGEFKLGGKIDGFFEKPFFISRTYRLSLGESFSTGIPVLGATRIEHAGSSIPAWISINRATGEISGTPDTLGSWEIPLMAFNADGSLAGTLHLIVESTRGTLDSVLGGDCRLAMTTPQAPWSVVPINLADGKPGLAAASGMITNAASSILRLVVPGASRMREEAVLTFWYKTSTEFNRDFFECRVNGLLALDAKTSVPLRFSGESDWALCSVPLPARTALVELRYGKDASFSEGQDRVWAYGFRIRKLPVVKMVPRSVRVFSGSDLELSAEVSGAGSVQWTRDAVALRSAGAQTGTLSMRSVSVLDAGLYRLEAENEFGKTCSSPVRLLVDGPPQLEMTSPAENVLRTGDTLLLNARIGGSAPLVCVWRKDGRVIQSGPHAMLQRTCISFSTRGNYTLTVFNRMGSVSSGEISIKVLPK